ncbi:MAG: MgtC/SapB family protein [Clostridia bacterium]|nr:MgtC/SapB family protein [Clostridia bacterium]
MQEYLWMQAELFLRLVLAALCGVLIGYERTHRGKGAGVRTHLVVAAASALMMIISKYGFSDFSKIIVGNVAEYRLDPSRLAAQIVSGIGFLGAGMIYMHGRTPHGLTTAAGIWATSGIGMAIGAGMYLMGFLATGLIYVAQLVLHKNLRILQTTKEKRITLVVDENEGDLVRLQRLLEEHQIQVVSITYKKLENVSVRINLHIIVPHDFEDVQLMRIASQNEYIKAISSSSLEYASK